RSSVSRPPLPPGSTPCPYTTLFRSEPLGTHGDHGVPERARAESEFHPAARKAVEARDGAGDHPGFAQGMVEDVRGELHPFSTSRDEAQQGPGIVVGGLIGMVLEVDEIMADDCIVIGDGTNAC